MTKNMTIKTSVSPPWWTFLAAIPLGWPLLIIAGLLSDWYGITTRVLYRLHFGKWEYPAEGRITFIDRQSQPIAFEDATGYIRDGVTVWYEGGSLKEIEKKAEEGKGKQRIVTIHAANLALLRASAPYVSAEEKAWRKEHGMVEDLYEQYR